MVVLKDVEAGSRWFQQALGLTSGHGGPEYEMLMDGDQLVLQLHHWDAHEHPHLVDDDDPSRGNVEAAQAEVLDGPLYNPNGRQHEIWLRGPEGYRVVVNGPRS